MRGAILHQSFGFLTPGEIARGLVPAAVRRERNRRPEPIRFETKPRGGTGAQRIFRDPSNPELGGLEGPYQDQEAAFSQLNRQSRSFAEAGNQAAAQGFYAQALGLWQQMGSPPDLQAELAYTRDVLSGDASAIQASVAGERLLGTSLVNARPDSVAGAAWQGAKEGLREGAGNLAKGKFFFGENPLEELRKTVTDFSTPTPYALLALGYFVLRGR